MDNGYLSFSLHESAINQLYFYANSTFSRRTQTATFSHHVWQNIVQRGLPDRTNLRWCKLWTQFQSTSKNIFSSFWTGSREPIISSSGTPNDDLDIE